MANIEKSIPQEKFQPAIIDAAKSEELSKPSLSFWQDSWMRVRKNKAAIVSLVILAFIIIMAFLGPAISGKKADDQNVKHANLPAKIEILENVSWLPFDGTMVNKAGVEILVQKNT